MTDSDWESWHYKDIRDPIHGFVGVTERECEILDSPQMQRLRRIKQLACTNLVYPGATHTRFEHSLGVLHVADRIAHRISLDDQEREIVRIAALLHDVGHGPFSHVFDNVMSRIHGEYDHAKTAALVIQRTNLGKMLGDINTDVVSLLDSPKKYGVLGNIIASELDADRLDYLRRDSYFVGVEYGRFDLERIIHTLDRFIDESSGQYYLVTQEKGVDAVEDFLLARYYMHLQVYGHSVRLITDAMLVRCFEEAILRSDTPEFEAIRVGIEHKSFVSSLLSLDDRKVLDLIEKECKDHLRELAEMIGKRVLLKCAYERVFLSEKKVESVKKARISVADLLGKDNRKVKSHLTEIEKDIAHNAGVKPEWVFVQPLEVKNPWGRPKGPPILILTKDNTLLDFDDMHSLSGAENRIRGKIFVFCRAEDRDRVKKAAEDCINSL